MGQTQVPCGRADDPGPSSRACSSKPGALIDIQRAGRLTTGAASLEGSCSVSSTRVVKMERSRSMNHGYSVR